MAKESFLLYHGYYEPIKNLSFEDKGMLFDAIFQYSMHRNEPSNTSRIFMAFQFFKNQIDQDCKKYEKIVERNQKNGKKGGRPESEDQPKNPVGSLEAKKADTVTVTVTDTVTDTETETDKNKDVAVATIQQRKDDFYKTLVPYVEKYGKEMVREFFEYWVEISKNGKKLRFESEKFFEVSRRLSTWSGRNLKSVKHSNQKGVFQQ